MSDLVQTAVEHNGSRTTVTVTGDVDMATAPAVRKALVQAREADPRLLVVEMTQVRFLASAGLAILAEAAQGAEATGARMCVVAPHGGAPARALRITGLDALFKVVDTAAQAA
ncbi:STAS domain-containing protein [Actinokineospora pegani]|uniref:STAS domain-containing protein n=1 Tax=Actinokineospora pegani TaxID=2654637 RepID=UPI0012EA4AEB|nr:STAS domain-containing protein [Actinokineospora pegani]